MALIDKRELTFGKRGVVGKVISATAYKLLGLKKINHIYDTLSGCAGRDFTSGFLRMQSICYTVADVQRQNIPATGGVVVVANHPTGALDGILLIDLLASVRGDVKFLGNSLLSRIEPLKDFFIEVNPFDTKSSENVGGIRRALEHLERGGMLVVFPAGEVSTYQRRLSHVEDKPWSRSMMKFIRRTGLPVVPIYIDGANSRLFHLAGKVHPLLRTAMLPHELSNKSGKNVNIAVGAPVVQPRLDAPTVNIFSDFLRTNVYLLRETLAPKAVTISKKVAPAPPCDDVIAPVAKEILAAEVDSVKTADLLFESGNYSVLLSDSQSIPGVMTEIGRLREITFRRIGEGTSKEIDTDHYDDHYKHLFIWDNSAQCIVGAYRVGLGHDIVESHGLKGFYTNSLFAMSDAMIPIMEQAIELGRSFIVEDYQRKPATLMLLWKGILYVLMRYEQYRYLIGPVTISGEFSEVSKLLIVDYLRRNHFNYELSRNIKPHTGLDGLSRHMPPQVVEKIFSMDALNKIITDLEGGRFSVPVLIRKYMVLGGRVIGFNVDHDFFDALDGFLVVDLRHIPEQSLMMLSKEIDSEGVIKRFSEDVSH